MKKKSYSTGGKITPFGQAFQNARKSGQSTFSFGGKSYHTRTKEEENARIASGRPAQTEVIQPMASIRTAGPVGRTLSESSGLKTRTPESRPANATTMLKQAIEKKNAIESMDRKAYRKQAKSALSTEPGMSKKERRFENFKNRVDARMERKRKRASK